MLANLFRVVMVILSWISLLYYPTHSFRRFLPVTFFVTALVFILLALSTPLKLWRVAGGVGTKLINDLAFTLGPFFVVNLWVFKLVYGQVWKYLGLNLILDLVMAYPVSSLFKKLRIYELKRFKPLYFFIVTYSYAILAYGFQYFLGEPRRMN